MPATYRHVHTYNRSRNAWKKPEAPTIPAPKQYFVLGMEVDCNTYREYMYEREYRIDGDTLKDILCNLWTLEHYATEEHAKDYPVEAANARKILDRIREEIATITGKDDKNMKKPNTAADFIDALNDIYTESRSAFDAIQADVAAAKQKMERALEKTKTPSENLQIANAEYNIAAGEHTLAATEARNRYRAMISAHAAKVKELRNEFATFLDDHYAASPDKLDSATMALLNSGICTASELSRLVDRHHDNPVMLRIVGNHARKLREDNRRTMSHDDQAICAAVAAAGDAAKDGSRELGIFDSAVRTADYGLGKRFEDYAHATRMHGHVSGWLSDFKNQIVNLPLTPAAEAAESGGDE